MSSKKRVRVEFSERLDRHKLILDASIELRRQFVDDDEKFSVQDFTQILTEAGSGQRVVFQDDVVIANDQLHNDSLCSYLDIVTIKSSTAKPISRTERLADGVLIFACSSPKDAEAAVGDLIEKFNQVSARQPRVICYLYFAWELMLLVVTKGRQRLINSTIGPLIDKWFKGSAT